MTRKSATVNARIEPKMKLHAEKILQRVGIEPAEAIRAFYAQIILRKGMPIELVIPNQETRQAMKDVQEGKTFKVKNIKSLLDNLG